MKFYVGQMVKIKSKEELEKIEKFCTGITSGMFELSEQLCTIERYDEKNGIVFLKENSYAWDERAIDIIYIKDLVFGDIITTRDNCKYVFNGSALYGEDEEGYLDGDSISDFENNFQYYSSESSDFDIIKVERNGKVIYEDDKKIVEMTMKEICEKLGYNVKIVKEEE